MKDASKQAPGVWAGVKSHGAVLQGGSYVLRVS